MKIHYVRAMIERDPMTVIPVCVLATAIPILQMVHGGKLTDVHVQDQCADLDADDEYDRLARVYGERPNTGKTYAEEIYGSAEGLARRMFVPETGADANAASGDEDEGLGLGDDPADPDADIFGVGDSSPDNGQPDANAAPQKGSGKGGSKDRGG